MLEDERADGLDRLWEAYRQATPEPQISANFMPELWAKIDAVRPVSWTLPFTRLALRLVPLAAAVTLALGLYTWSPRSSVNGVFSYVDVLVADLLHELGDGEEVI